MFKLLLIITSLAVPPAYEPRTLTGNVLFATFEECDAYLSTDDNIEALATALTQITTEDNVPLTFENKCEAVKTPA